MNTYVGMSIAELDAYWKGVEASEDRVVKMIEDMIHDGMPGGYIVLLRQVRDLIIGGKS